ncbi:unnamed protein product [Notodromas monacha]|nr:unnamed protein product [Notodromas monacha]CAG0925476.1 unnamed protein product [Notodromas monacha]
MSEMDLIYDKDDLRALQYICAVVSLRAAQLVAICVGYLLTRMNKPTATIAVDGSLYKNHPRLKGLMDHYTAVYAPGCKFQYMLALDGSGKGAGMVAAIAKRLTEKRTKSESDPN